MGFAATTHASIASANWEYLREALRCLDLRIQLEISKRRNPRVSNPLAEFQGLVISDEEVSELLAGPTCDTPGSLSLVDDLRALEAQLEERRSLGGHLLPRLAALFGLSRFEEWCVLLCLAPELDRKYERLYAYLQDDLTQKKPKVDLAFKLGAVSGPALLVARETFRPAAPLVKYRLLHVGCEPEDERAPLLSRSLKLDDRVADYLLGLDCLDRRLAPIAHIQSSCDIAHHWVHEQALRRLREFLDRHPQQHILFHLHGPDGSGVEAVPAAGCAEAGLTLITIDMSRPAASSITLEEMAIVIGREARLHDAAVCLTNADGYPNLEYLGDVIGGMSRLVFLVGHRRWKPLRAPDGPLLVDVEVGPPDHRTRQRLWEAELEHCGASAEALDVPALANHFPFGAPKIHAIVDAAKGAALWRSGGRPALTMEDMYFAGRASASPRLGGLAARVVCRRGWSDLVLPPDQTDQLREICNQAKHRQLVYEEWGFERKLAGGGIHVIFAGPPGTGKTMAAEVIAGELHLDLYKVDLSQVVSKYIGETEKNLHTIFEEARAANVVLFFDEADALFGKRSEVRDAHDRFANIEIAYLLQKMDEYDGVVVLATNLRQHLDEAFLRRMQAMVEFPFPDDDLRRRIWQAIFPPEAPLAADIDLAALAREVKLAGGNIRNIALAAAFYAAEADAPIGMDHLWRATRREYQKLGRTWTRAEG
jgi:hypothetical protein